MDLVVGSALLVGFVWMMAGVLKQYRMRRKVADWVRREIAR